MDENNLEKVVEKQRGHFKDLYDDHEGTPYAVASETYEHKRLRYSKISDIFPEQKDFSVYEIGYGLGHFYKYLTENFGRKTIDYSGAEIVEEYHGYCLEHYSDDANFQLRNIIEEPLSEEFDYVVMSGVFHQIGKTSVDSWEEYMYELIEQAFEISTKAIAFNFLSEFVDYEQEGNYYANIHEVIQFVNRELSRFFELKHAYPLYEGTMFVYHPEFIESRYPEEEFKKYL